MEPSAAPDAGDAVPDGDLARRVAGGDRAAEAELCRRLFPRVRLYGLRHLRDAAAAADLAQDVLLTVLARLRQGALREPDRVASFVLGTCRQLATASARTRRRRDALLASEPPPEPARPVDPLPHERLVRCLSALAARERTIVLATFYAEQPADDIAREHGISAGNVRVLRHRALRRLRDCLGLQEAS